MKINFIINKDDYNSTLDSSILNFLFRKIKDKTEIKIVDINNFKCENVSINFFLGSINNLLLKHAKCNIFIPNNQVFSRDNIPFLNNFDYIFVKSRILQTLLENFVHKEKIKYISWRSTDLSNSIHEKKFNEVLLYCYDKNYTQYNTIINSWKESYPTLNIVNYEPIKQSSNIIYHSNLTQVKFELLFNKCGIHLCLQESDCFAHNMNQCALSKSIPIAINGAPMNEFLNKDDYFSINGKKKKINKYIGNKTILNIDNLHKVVEEILRLNEETLKNMGNNCRNYALKNHSINDDLFKDTIKKILLEVRNKKTNKDEEIEDYPNVSIVTLVHNRLDFFDLSVFNYNNTHYPKKQLEWIIYDTSIEEEKVDSKLPPLEERKKQNIKYFYDTEKLTIGEKRNKAIDKCTNEVVVFMDDDDYYYNKSVQKRVKELILSKKQITGCTIIGSFNINKGISFIESSNFETDFHNRVSIATLGFYKSFWENNKFDNESINEASTMIKNNYNLFHEISWEEVIVSLVHKYNLTNRITPDTKPNGNYYNFSKGLFNYLVTLQNK
jgi:hypothetical protein